MNKKLKMFLSAMMVIMMVTVMFLNVYSYAATAAPDPGQVVTGSSDTDTTGIQNIGNQIVTIISTIGSIVSVIVLVVLGIKYMMGSAEEKAEYKKTLMPYIIGAGLVFAASAIAGIIFGFTQGLSG